MQETNDSYIRAAREVLPDRGLSKFLARVAAVGSIYFEPSDLTFIPQDASLEQQLEPGYRVTQTTVHVPSLEVYDIRSLRLTHFEHYSSPDCIDELYQLIKPVRALRLDKEPPPVNTAGYQVAVSEKPTSFDLRADAIVPADNNTWSSRGQQYSLQLCQDETYQTLLTRAVTLGLELNAGPAALLIQDMPVLKKLELPIFRLPAAATEQQKTNFLNHANTYLMRYEVDFRVGPIRWTVKD